nr:DUF3990 domain-containing protein [Faecalicoccus pleomorphus]
MSVENPDLSHSSLTVDFGRVFYVALYYEQAIKWRGKFKRRGKDGFVTRYTFNEESSLQLNIYRYDSYSEEWLDFILNCRRRQDNSDYDLMVGGAANDKVFNMVELYFDNLIDKKEAIHRLRFEKPNLQYCFRTQKALNLLEFVGSEKI